MKKRSLLSLLLMLVLVLSAFAPAMAEEVIKIGGLGVLSGPAAQYGEACKEGMDLYVEQLNAKGGVLGKQIQFIWEDTEGDDTKAINAFNKLVDNDEVVAILGAVLTNETKAVAEFSEQIGIPQITPSATAYDVTTGRPNVFRTCFLDPVQAVAIARYMKEEGFQRPAVMYDKGNEYSNGLYESFAKECEAQGLEIVAAESAAYSDVDFKTQLTTIKSASPDSVFLPYYGNEAAMILTQAKELGLDVKFFGADGIADIVELISSKDLLPNLVYTDHFSVGAQNEMAVEFVKAYKEKYGKEPTISFSATGYDAALVLFSAIEKADNTEYEAVVKAIKESNVAGVSGFITFDDHNDPIKSIFFQTFDDQGNKVFVKQLDP
ncbi:MAG: ABC transporter substrate-binding protein [Christensenellales bacterium]|jgi:branched-chain amino acid transport system substrate-binding protein